MNVRPVSKLAVTVHVGAYRVGSGRIGGGMAAGTVPALTKFTKVVEAMPEAEAVGISGERILAVGTEAIIMPLVDR
jgi:hypothetical protein